MSLASTSRSRPVRPAGIVQAAEHVDPQALIEEARALQHRRLRRRVGFVALLLGLLVAAQAVGGRLYASSAQGNEAGLPAAERDSPVVGLLTVARLPEVRPGIGPEAFYGVSAVGRDGRLHPIVRCPGGRPWCGEVLSAAWSPDGSRLAVSTTAMGTAVDGLGLRVIDVADGSDRLLLGASSPSRPRATCGGRRVVGVPGGMGYEGLAWSPDGSRIAYACGGAIGVVGVAAGSHARLVEPAVPGPVHAPSWSPDGSRIVFAAGGEEVGAEPWMDHRTTPSATIWLAGLDGENPTLLAEHAVGAPSWSPSGSAVAYQSGCGTVRLVDLAGNDVTPPASAFECGGGIVGKPIWSPDGSRLAISGEQGLWLLRPDGSAVERLTELPSNGVTGPWNAPASWRGLQ